MRISDGSSDVCSSDLSRPQVAAQLPAHTVSLEEARQISQGPQVYQFYFHKDRGLNRDMMARARQAGVEVMMLTVDSITGGNRERDKRTGFAIPDRQSGV